MKRLSLFLLSLLTSSQAMAAPEIACRCGHPGLKNAYAQVDAVALVKIRSVTKIPGTEDVVGSDVWRMEVEELQSWKSKPTKRNSEIFIVSTNGVCGYYGSEGETHLLYLKKQENGFGTANCMGNLPKEVRPKLVAERIKWLNRHGKRT